MSKNDGNEEEKQKWKAWFLRFFDNNMPKNAPNVPQVNSNPKKEDRI